MNTPTVAQAATNPAAALLRGGALPALAVGIAVSMGCLFSGRSEAASAGFGGVLAIAALAVGPILLRLGRHSTPTGLMVLAVCGYGAVVFSLATAYALVSHASWLIGEFAAAGILACSIAWLIGQARSTSRLRVLTYGSHSEPGP